MKYTNPQLKAFSSKTSEGVCYTGSSAFGIGSATTCASGPSASACYQGAAPSTGDSTQCSVGIGAGTKLQCENGGTDTSNYGTTCGTGGYAAEPNGCGTGGSPS